MLRQLESFASELIEVRRGRVATVKRDVGPAEIVGKY